MVALDAVHAANIKATTTLPPGLVAVFAGSTAGIGELALKGFTKHAQRPKIYFIGRSEEAGERLLKELKALNADGEYVFVKADMSLLKNTDEVCRDIQSKEKAINVLYMSQGTLRGGDTSEGLPYITSLTYYSRMRLVANLLPLIRQASSHRRVVSTFAAGTEGHIYTDDIPGRKVPLTGARGHLAGAMTLALEALSRGSPEVSFVHNFPGSVKTNLIRKEDGLVLRMLAAVAKLAPQRMWMDNDECAERHAFLCLGSRFPAAAGEVKRDDGVEVVRGSGGKVGSGVYSIDQNGDCAPEKALDVLKKHRDEGVVDKIWKHTEGEFERVTGTASI